MDEKINRAYEQLSANKGLCFAFSLSVVLRIFVPVILPSIDAVFYFGLILILCVLLPIFLFFRLQRDLVKTLLVGTLTYKRAIIVGSISGMIVTAITFGFLMVLCHSHIVTVPFDKVDLLEFIKRTFYDNLKSYRSATNFFTSLWLLVYTCLLGPFSEEIIFQGWLQTKLSQKWGNIAVVLGVTTIFMFCHREINPFMFVSLLVFAIIQLKTRSILACTIAHGLINFGKFPKVISFCLIN